MKELDLGGMLEALEKADTETLIGWLEALKRQMNLRGASPAVSVVELEER